MATTSYATPSDFLKRYDVRVAGDLCSDTGTRVTGAALLTNVTLQAMLDDATSEIDAALLVSERYSHADLVTLLGTDNALLLRLCSDLAYIRLVQRRGTAQAEKLPQYAWVMTMLEKLRLGERVFNLPEDLLEGVPTAQFPDIVDYATLGLLRDISTPRFFPRRVDQQEIG